MTVKPNGTDAKDIALHFIDVTAGRATPHIMAKTINQAKTLLASGYTKKEVIKSIDYVIDKKGIKMYSLGYINTCINNILEELSQLEVKEKVREEISVVQENARIEVIDNNESTQRNRDKLNRFGVQSRFGEEFNIDMFKGK